jgi:hypothetical protein
VSEPVAPLEVEFCRDFVVDGHRVGAEVIAHGLEHQDGNVAVARVIRGKPAVTLWMNTCDAAEELGADHVNYRNPVLVSRLRRVLADGNDVPVVGSGKERAR